MFELPGDLSFQDKSPPFIGGQFGLGARLFQSHRPLQAEIASQPNSSQSPLPLHLRQRIARPPVHRQLVAIDHAHLHEIRRRRQQIDRVPR